MRVLHVVASGLRRGAEVFASDLVRALDDQGVTQHVAVLRGDDTAVPYEAPVTRLGRAGWQVPIVRVNPRTLRGLKTLIAEWEPDIVQAHGGEPLKYSVPVTFGSSAPPVVYRRIGSAGDEIAAGSRRVAYAGLMRRAAKVIAVADVVRRETIDIFRVPARRVVTIPNGVDPSRVEPHETRETTRRRLDVPAHATVVLSVGALVWEKDPLTQLEIAARMVRDDPNLVYLMAGDGPMRRDVEKAVRGLALDGRVRLLGVRGDVADLLAASDLLLFASRSEGMAASVIEAGMAGLPVAAFSVGGTPEVVEDGVTGILARPGDVEGLAHRSASLLMDRGALSTMAEAARAACARFAIGEIGSRYLDVYRGLVTAN